jgi:hypothetical protein
LVERDLAKVEVVGSRPITRSTQPRSFGVFLLSLHSIDATRRRYFVAELRHLLQTSDEASPSPLKLIKEFQRFSAPSKGRAVA